MTPEERRALVSLRFEWAPTREELWTPLEAHVDEVNDHATSLIMHCFRQAADSTGPSPIGLVVLGEKGSGKSHALNWTRDRVLHGGGYFFPLWIWSGEEFWRSIAHALLQGLRRRWPDGTSQLTTVLGRLADQVGLDAVLTGEILGRSALTPEGLARFVRALRAMDDELGLECQHVARALTMIGSTDLDAREVAQDFLTAEPDFDRETREHWRIPRSVRPAHRIVAEMSRLIAVTGPAVIAVDQIDTMIAQSRRAAGTESTDEAQDDQLEKIGAGLMELRDTTRRTLTIVACMGGAWELLSSRTLDSVADRFRDVWLTPIASAEIGRRLAEDWMGVKFRGCGFTPPYPTWPILPQAFDDAVLFTPRQLLKHIAEHAEACLAADEVTELARLDKQRPVTAPARPAATVEPPAASAEALQRLDDRFRDLVAATDANRLVVAHQEDEVMPDLFWAGLHTWILERGETDFEPERGSGTAYHALLRQSLDETIDDEQHWYFRALRGPHHRTVTSKINHLCSIAGLDPEVPKRKVVILRTGKWQAGQKTRQRIDDFIEAGGAVLEHDPNDLSVFSALKTLIDEKDAAFAAWARSRCPAGRTALFRSVFGEPNPVATDADGTRQPDEPTPAPPEPPEPPVPPAPPRQLTIYPPPLRAPRHARPRPGQPKAPDKTTDSALTNDVIVDENSPPPGVRDVPGAPTLLLGTTVDGCAPVTIPLEALRKHVAVFAGSGSGKTVLLRRLVEECALQGVSSIVLDPNNDLARLGDPWPQAPTGWGPGDARKAADYIAGTDVVVWTPRREAGRPLSLQPLPDFSAVADDPDEFSLAVESAVATLAPRARMISGTAKADRGRAVLREALEYFARHGGTGLGAFIDLLAELPGEVTSMAKADSIAADMAQTLTAAMINDPLFGGSGVALDPGVLLTPGPGRRARVSVISFVGLPANEQRQSFVNQLQMALFAWVKQHPAGGRPLGGLYVMDEAQTLAPSGVSTACTESTLALASQARKYGLGLVFATQAPRGIHNRIAGNAATQFFGFLNSPVQITAAKEIAAAKSGAVDDISRLSAGQFYVSTEGVPHRKVTSALCLSHHPSSALSTEEVLTRARAAA